jgi:hypothetical protein
MTTGLLLKNKLYAQKPVVIVENTLKLMPLKEEIFYYGFAAGDKLVLNFEEINGKEIKEIRILELPSSSRFMDSKVSMIKNKTIEVSNQGIYQFHFINGILPRTVKFSIQRIPSDASTQSFNTTVFTRVVQDTIYMSDEEQYIDRTDTVITVFQDRVVKILGGAANKATFNFSLPENTIAWSYYFYTDEAGKKIFDEASKKTPDSKQSKFSGKGPLAMEILRTTSHLTRLTSGTEIGYWIVENENADLFLNGGQFRFIKKGSGINDFSRMDNRKGSLNFCFSTGASTQPATITVKIASMHINEYLKTRKIKQIQSVRPKNEMYLKN